MDNNQKLIEALNDAHNAIEKAINTLRNQAAQLPDLNEMEKRITGNSVSGSTLIQSVRDVVKHLKRMQA